MSNTEPNPPTKAASLPERSGRLTLFGPPPLVEGEDAGAYDELLARISGAVKPSDILEEIWVRDVVDLVWDTLRLRRLKANLMNAAARQGLERVLQPLLDIAENGETILELSFRRCPAEALARKWALRDRDAVNQVDTLLTSAGLTMDAVMAQALSLVLNEVERVDHMIMTMEARRNAVLREVDRHRATWGEQLRRLAQQAEDVEFEVIEPKPVANENAA